MQVKFKTKSIKYQFKGCLGSQVEIWENTGGGGGKSVITKKK